MTLTAYVKVKGSWKYLYRVVDTSGAMVDFLLTAKQDRKAALRFLRKAINGNGTPEKITIDKSGANTAAIESYDAGTGAEIEIRRIKYLANIVEQDHRAIKRLIRPTLGFKSFRSAAVTLAGIELMQMIPKGQLRAAGRSVSGAAVLFAGGINPVTSLGLACLPGKFATEPIGGTSLEYKRLIGDFLQLRFNVTR